MADRNSIIRVDRDGVEFFTVASTGESGMSVSGLAIVLGSTHQSVSKLLLNLATKSPSKWLNHLVGMSLNLATEGVKKGGKTKVIKSAVCSAVIRHYAFSGNERAQDFMAALEDAAMDVFIQKITGWQPPSEVDRFIETHLLRDARPWEAVFDRAWIAAAQQCTGWKWSDRVMAKLINAVVYDRLPAEVRTALDKYNPILSNGYRARKQHQHFSDESVEQILRMQIEIARSLLMVSTSWQELKENARRRFEGMSQLRLM